MKQIKISIQQTGALHTEKNLGGEDAFVIPVMITSNNPEINTALAKVDIIFEHNGDCWEMIDSLKSKIVNIQRTLAKEYGGHKAYKIEDKIETRVTEFANSVVVKSFNVLKQHFKNNAKRTKSIIQLAIPKMIT